jgi:hypothetical protein
MNIKGIPTSSSKEDIKIREKIIMNFYQEWKRNNPSQRLYNLDLEDYINIRYISIVETVEHSSKSYLSTLAVLQLDCILKLAKKVRVVDTKRGDKNQNKFEKMIKMEYELVGIGKVSLVVGIKRTNKEKVQYCITVIKT